MSADLLLAASPDTDTPPTKKRKIENDIVAAPGDSFGVEKGANGNGVSLSGAKNGGRNMAENGNGVNGAENNGAAAPAEIDEGLYSRQLFVLGELKKFFLNQDKRFLCESIANKLCDKAFVFGLIGMSPIVTKINGKGSNGRRCSNIHIPTLHLFQHLGSETLSS